MFNFLAALDEPMRLHATNTNNRPRECLISTKQINNAELKLVLEKYIKAKLPTHLNQKNECLFAPATYESKDIDILSKSYDYKRQFSNDNLALNTLNSIYY